MARDVETTLSDMRDNPEGIKFTDIRKVAEHFFAEFGKPRIAGSHHIYKTPWPGDPRINIQKDGPKAKRYQAIQMLEAVDKLKALRGSEAAKAPVTEKPAGKRNR
jgi:hypothetical protein